MIRHVQEQHLDSVWREWNRILMSIIGYTCVYPAVKKNSLFSPFNGAFLFCQPANRKSFHNQLNHYPTIKSIQFTAYIILNVSHVVIMTYHMIRHLRCFAVKHLVDCEYSPFYQRGGELNFPFCMNCFFKIEASRNHGFSFWKVI